MTDTPGKQDFLDALAVRKEWVREYLEAGPP